MVWELRIRDYADEERACALPCTPCARHPLQAVESSGESSEVGGGAVPAPATPLSADSDPLTAALSSGDFDPLGASRPGQTGRAAVDSNPIGVSERRARPRDARRSTGAPRLRACWRPAPHAGAQRTQTRRLRCLRTQRLQRSGTQRSRPS